MFRDIPIIRFGVSDGRKADVFSVESQEVV